MGIELSINVGEFVGVLWKRVRFRIDYILVILPTVQSLRHGYAAPPPFTQGRLFYLPASAHLLTTYCSGAIIQLSVENE